MWFLLSELTLVSCCRLGEVINISHDSVNRFLNRESYSPSDLFNEAKSTLNLKGGTLSVDDTVLDKPYAKYISYIGYFWSGKHHKAVKGINLITLYYTDPNGQSQPINFRIQVRNEVAVKNHLFAAICSYVQLQKLRAIDVLTNCYALRHDLFNEVIASFIKTFIPSMEHMNSKFQRVVNA